MNLSNIECLVEGHTFDTEKEKLNAIFACDCPTHSMDCAFQKWDNYCDDLKRIGLFPDDVERVTTCYCMMHMRRNVDARSAIKECFEKILELVDLVEEDPAWKEFLKSKIDDCVNMLRVYYF